MRTRHLRPIFVLFGVALGYGCGGSTAPTQLQRAESAYDRVARSDEGLEVPEDVQKARQTLLLAQIKYEEGRYEEANHYAYLAERQAMLSSVKGRALMDEGTRAAALSAKVESGRAEKSSDSFLIGQTAGTDTQDNAKRYAAVVKELQKWGGARTDYRGAILALSSDKLFVTGKSTLSKSGTFTLNGVADVLKKNLTQDDRVRIEDHTSLNGNIKKSSELADARAKSIANYLAARGLPHNRISSEGKPQIGAVADQHVEIFISPPIIDIR